MKLPAPLYEAVKQHMGDHGAWHLARFRERWLPVPERAEWRAARAQFPKLRYLDEPGAGEDFMRFHRTMLVHFRVILEQHKDSGFVFAPWTRIPAHLEARLAPALLAASYGRILELIHHGTLDQLGAFLERTEYDVSFGSNLHTMLHGMIDADESAAHPGDPTLREASMADLSVAHYNEHFWTLHAWIDNLYTAWEKLHPESAVSDPAPDPHAHHHGTPQDPGAAHQPPPSAPPAPSGPDSHDHHGGDPTVNIPAHHHVRPVV